MHPSGRLFAAVAFIEAVTWAGLLIGMWMKYGPMANVALVKLFGPLHGVAFLLYVAVTLFAPRGLGGLVDLWTHRRRPSRHGVDLGPDRGSFREEEAEA